MKVGYIGLGAMGGSLARHLLVSHDLTVYDLNPANAAEFARLGAGTAASAGDLADAADVIVLCLPRSTDVDAVLFGEAGIVDYLRPGQLVVDQTSGVPSLTRNFAKLLADRGVLFMDAPVSGGIPAARAGAVTIIASGSDDAWRKGEPVLRAMSSKVLHCGTRVGDGQALKLITNGIGACYRLSTLELATLWRRFGLPLAELVSALNEGQGANFTSRNMLVGLLEGRSTTNFAMNLMVKDLNGALALGAETSQAMPLTSTARGLMQSAIALFGKDALLDDVIPLTEKLSKVRFASDDPDADVVALPDGISARDLLATMVQAAAACNVASVLEGARVGRGLGLEIESMARVVDAGSAWCRMAAPLFEALKSTDNPVAEFAAEGDALQYAVSLAAPANIPFIMPSLALSVWRKSFL